MSGERGGLVGALLVQGYIKGRPDSVSYQPIPELWARVPAEDIDIVAPQDRIGRGWSPTSVLIQCALEAMPEGDLVESGVEHEFRHAMSENGSVRPLINIPERAITIGLAGGFLHEGMDLWSDTQYILDSRHLILRQQTFTCELSRRNDYVDAMHEIRDWFMSIAL